MRHLKLGGGDVIAECYLILCVCVCFLDKSCASVEVVCVFLLVFSPFLTLFCTFNLMSAFLVGCLQLDAYSEEYLGL